MSSCHCEHVTTTHHHHCHHHCHHHHYETKRRHHRRHHHPESHSKRSPLPVHHKKQQHHIKPLQLNKSSLDTNTSEEHRPQLHSAAIAIEIDAATVTENNSSTATSNFPYKVASEGGGAPMNLIPLCEQHRQRRRGSLNSNTTIETDELSRDDDDEEDDDDDDDVHLGIQPEDEEQLTPAVGSSSSSTARAFAGAAPARNECVRIKRKRFVPDAMQDYCSSCSRCSSCSCDQARTSSCSSLDEDLAHELTVSAECHRCMTNEQNSLKSFCSCHTNNCCCGRCSNEEEYAGDEDDDDDDDETTGQRESFCTAADHTIVSTPTQEDMHSSTLTPLSTQEHTMRSEIADDNEGDGITDADASSLSQSAEYFSLSSTVGGAATTAKEEQPHCSNSSSGNHNHSKHWSKHIRLKRSSSPLDSHL